jgi:Fe-S cluster assembly ATPase SufC
MISGIDVDAWNVVLSCITKLEDEHRTMSGVLTEMHQQCQLM